MSKAMNHLKQAIIFEDRQLEAKAVLVRLQNKEEVNRWLIFSLRDFLNPMTRNTELQEVIQDAIESCRETL